jgi:hypothetical protein
MPLETGLICALSIMVGTSVGLTIVALVLRARAAADA